MEMEIDFSGPVNSTCSVSLVCCALFTLLDCRASEPVKVIELWPNGAPGEKGNIGEERDTTKPTDPLIAGKPVVRLGNVSKPTIGIYRPPADKRTGAAVLVFPGGGYHILVMDLEGTEVCDWLNSIGVTAVLLKLFRRHHTSTQQPFQRRGAKLLSFTREPREIFAGVPRLVLRLRQRQSFCCFSANACPARRAEGEQGG